MRESAFIEKNKEKWARYERALEESDTDPELLNELYIHTTDDLSFSRTFFPNRSVRIYLNGLAQRTLLQLYRGRRGEAGRFFTFWSEELPLSVYRQRKSLLLSLAIFVLAMLIGIVSYQMDEAFAEVILGDAYVNMTRANIASGDPMAVYKEMAPFQMSLRITFNNITVALLTFISGVFFAVGSVVQLIRNGVMVGVFQYFFYDQGLLRESFLTIWMHGALEISSIVIAGGAGIAAGSGLLFPGTLSRFAAFRRSGKAGLQIMLGTVPLFIIAGFLEGFVTRHTELPDALRALFITACFAFILWYYVIYPWRVSQGAPTDAASEIAESPPAEQKIELNLLRSSGENLTITFAILRQQAGLYFGGIALITLGYTFLSFAFFSPPPAERYYFDGSFLGDFHNVHELTASFSNYRSFFFLLLVAGSFYALLLLTYRLLDRAIPVAGLPTKWVSFSLVAISLMLAFSLAFSSIVAALSVGFLFPVLLTVAHATYAKATSFPTAVRYVFTSLPTTYSNFLMITIMAFFGSFVLTSTVGQLFFAFLDWVIFADPVTIDNTNVILQCALYFFIFGLVFCLWATSFALNFYHLQEIATGKGLLERIGQVGKQRVLRGMTAEDS